MQNRGVEFLTVTNVYYKDLRNRIGKIDENIDVLQPLGILVDRDEEGWQKREIELSTGFQISGIFKKSKDSAKRFFSSYLYQYHWRNCIILMKDFTF